MEKMEAEHGLLLNCNNEGKQRIRMECIQHKKVSTKESARVLLECHKSKKILMIS